MDVDNPLARLSQLERLPLELAFSILEMIPWELLYKYRLASRHLKHHVDSFPMLPEPAVKSVAIRGSGNYAAIAYIIDIHPSDRKKFELRAICRSPAGLLNDWFKLPVLLKSFDIAGKTKSYSLCADSLFDDLIVIEHVGACLGSRIGTVECRNNYIAAASTLLFGMKIGELRVHGELLSDNELSSLVLLCSANSIEHLVLNVMGFTNSDAGEALLKLASLVSSIAINCDEWKLQNNNNQCLLFVPGVDWAPVILGMFERKLERLRITNERNFGYLSRRSADWLIEKLSLLKKKFVFETSSGQYNDGLEYMMNGCTIRVDSNNNNGFYIRHLTIFN